MVEEGEEAAEGDAETAGKADGGSSDEVRGVPGLQAPRQPTRAEIEEHRRSGCQPPRSWCPFCVGARCVASPHSASNGEQELTTVSLDYCYPDASEEDELRRHAAVAILVERFDTEPFSDSSAK